MEQAEAEGLPLTVPLPAPLREAEPLAAPLPEGAELLEGEGESVPPTASPAVGEGEAALLLLAEGQALAAPLMEGLPVADSQADTEGLEREEGLSAPDLLREGEPEGEPLLALEAEAEGDTELLLEGLAGTERVEEAEGGLEREALLVRVVSGVPWPVSVGSAEAVKPLVVGMAEADSEALAEGERLSAPLWLALAHWEMDRLWEGEPDSLGVGVLEADCWLEALSVGALLLARPLKEAEGQAESRPEAEALGLRLGDWEAELEGVAALLSEGLGEAAPLPLPLPLWLTEAVGQAETEGLRLAAPLLLPLPLLLLHLLGLPLVLLLAVALGHLLGEALVLPASLEALTEPEGERVWEGEAVALADLLGEGVEEGHCVVERDWLGVADWEDDTEVV